MCVCVRELISLTGCGIRSGLFAIGNAAREMDGCDFCSRSLFHYFFHYFPLVFFSSRSSLTLHKRNMTGKTFSERTKAPPAAARTHHSAGKKSLIITHNACAHTVGILCIGIYTCTIIHNVYTLYYYARSSIVYNTPIIIILLLL